MICHGNGETHCCWFKDVLCPHLEEDTVEGRRWACGLFRELGDWDLVLSDPRYEEVAELYASIGKPEWNCRDWPQNIPEVMDQRSGRCCWELDSDDSS